MLFKKLLAQLGDQTDTFRKFYLPAGTLYLPKMMGWVLRYATEEIFWWLLLIFHSSFFYWFVPPNELIKTRFFLFCKLILSQLLKVMNITNFAFCKSPFLCKKNDNLVAAAWDHTFYFARHHKKIRGNLLI